MLGLIIAAMFSATMGNLSSHFNVRASVLTNDVYRRLFRPHAGEKELVTAGRAMTVVVGGSDNARGDHRWLTHSAQATVQSTW